MKIKNREIEKYRDKEMELKIYGVQGDSCNGVFKVPFRNCILNIIASNGGGWEHVSVSLPNRCPIWDEMSFIKDLFFNDDETVVQYHPSKKNYVNIHNYCLHLWRPIKGEILLPQTKMV